MAYRYNPRPGDWVLIGYSAKAILVTRVTPTRVYCNAGREGQEYEQHYDKKHITWMGNGQSAKRLERDLAAAREVRDAEQTEVSKRFRNAVQLAYATANEEPVRE